MSMGQVIGKRYEVQDVIGEGGMGVVYHVWDRLEQEPVALKTVLTEQNSLNFSTDPNTSSDFNVALAHEFRTLASLRHPNIISVLDYGFLEDQLPFFTMTLLEKPQDLLLAAEGLSLQGKIQLAIQVLQALAYLHHRGIIHRDLKPGNILVRLDGVVNVVDFGLAAANKQESSEDSLIVGTMAYIAPEIFMGSKPSIASDQYALGIILYQMFSGDLPYDIDNPGVYIQDTISTLPELSHLDASESVKGVIARLLEKDPHDRYSDAHEVIRALASAVDLEVEFETEAARESFLEAAAFTGRDEELGLLTRALVEARESGGSAWLLAGESGIGKSRLLSEVQTYALVEDFWILKGEAQQTGANPYMIWREVIRKLVLLADIPPQDLALFKFLVPDLESLVQEPLPEPRAMEPQQVQKRFHSIVLQALQSLSKPVCMIFEDLHWVGQESKALIETLIQEIHSLPVLLLMSYRDDERPELAQEFPAANHMQLKRLSQDHLSSLISAMIGRSNDDLLDFIQHETEGNIFFVVEVVRALVEEAGDRHSIGTKTLPREIFSGGIQEILRKRLEKIPEEFRTVLRYAALYGRQIDPLILQELAPEIDLDRWIMRCTQAAILEVRDDRWYFSHDKLRQRSALDMPEEERASAHREIAHAIQNVYQDTITAHCAQLSHHFYEAGDLHTASQYTMVLGEQAFNIGHFEEALKPFEQALSMLPEDAQAERSPILNWQARSYAYLGENETAKAIYQENLSGLQIIRDEPGIAYVQEQLGDLSVQEEAFTEASAYFQESIALYRKQDDTNSLARILNKIGNVYIQIGEEDLAIECYDEALSLSRSRRS